MKSIPHLVLAAGMLFSLPWIISAQQTNPPKSEKNASPAVPAGPENGGLRMRMKLETSPKSSATKMEVEITNVSEKPVTLRGGGSEDHNTGDLKEYVEAAISIETTPAIQPWTGQVAMRGRAEEERPEKTLQPGETLTLSWSTDGKTLKNKVSNPLYVQNPEFPQPGLYAVRATLAISTGGEPILLRSNEQFFAAGGSNALPKSTWGHLKEVDKDSTAIISLGALEKVAVGDQFRIRTGYSEYYRLSITKTEAEWSFGVLFPEPLTSELSKAGVPYPKVGQGALLATDKLPVPDKTGPAPQSDAEKKP